MTAAMSSGITMRSKRRCGGWSRQVSAAGAGRAVRQSVCPHFAEDLLDLDADSALLQEWTARVRT
jgi:hypothetical protein